MISAVFSASGRSDAAHAALLLARAHQAAGSPVALIRIRRRPEAQAEIAPGSGIFPVDRLAFSDQEAALAADREISAALWAGREVVLDLPLGLMADDALRARLDAALLVVGPTDLDERTAVDALLAPGATTSAARLDREAGTQSDNAAPVWLLGCGRGGGRPAAALFERTVRHAAGDEAVRVLPFVLPPRSRAAAQALAAGRLRAETLRDAAILLSAVELVAADRSAETVDRDALAQAAGATPLLVPDDRTVGERLRELGEELDALREGHFPTPEDLEFAPLLDDWSTSTTPVTIMVGRVHGHPSIPDGRLIHTSTLFATDGDRYARTISRVYRLGRPAEAPAGSLN